jgi:hypothetical protein
VSLVLRRSRWSPWVPLWVVVVLMGLSVVGIRYAVRQAMKPAQHACAAQMRNLGVALATYANEHEGRLPDTLDTLIEADYVLPESLRCPMAVWEGRDGRYHYIAGLTRDDDASLVVVYDDVSNHDGYGGTAVFLDYHAEFLKADALRAAVARTEEYLERKATERRSDEATEGEEGRGREGSED